ncbi:MAG: 2-oxo acid dehydrogenase subunit E2 [Candidatus Omnitrophota bacterium]
MTDILIPQLSENIKSGTVTRIAVKPGDAVFKGQTLLELETEKAVLEVPSPNNGTVAEVLIKVGDEIKPGQLAFLFSGDAPAPAAAAVPNAPAVAAPLVATKENLPELTNILRSALPSATAASVDVAAAPSVRRFARELGINIGDVPASGRYKRVSIEDIKAYAKDRMTTRVVSAGPGGVEHPPLPDFSKWGDTSREKMSAIRKKTAAHMAYCWATIPHITQFAKADITEVDKLRQKRSTPELKLTITPFLIKVIAAALKQFPKLNASVDMAAQEVIFKTYYNIGIAVDTPNGLLVPVIKNADQKSILAIAAEMQALAEKARARKLTMEEMQGGTFTVTNLGGITSGHFTPIVNAPESAILGISRAQLEPCYNNGSLCAPRLMLPLSLSYDHRLVDGADGARFIKFIVDAIEQPLMLEL